MNLVCRSTSSSCLAPSSKPPSSSSATPIMLSMRICATSHVSRNCSNCIRNISFLYLCIQTRNDNPLFFWIGAYVYSCVMMYVNGVQFDSEASIRRRKLFVLPFAFLLFPLVEGKSGSFYLCFRKSEGYSYKYCRIENARGSGELKR